MATATNNSPPSPAPPAADAADKPVTNPKSTLYAIGGGVAALLLSLALASPKVFVGFLFGAVCALGGLFVGLVYLLNYAEKSVFEDYNAELKRKEDQPKYEGKPLAGADMQGYVIQAFGPLPKLPPSPIWQWGELKGSFLHIFDLKGAPRAAVTLQNARITVIKTKTGRVWRPTNYIRVSNGDKPVTGDRFECFFFFRNSKEMEEWYLALRTATTIHQRGAEATVSARRQHFIGLMKAVGFDYQTFAQPAVPRPATMTGNGSDQSNSGANSASSSSASPSSSASSSSLSMSPSTMLKSDGSDHMASKWFNLLMHRVFFFLFDDPGFMGLVKKKIGAKLAKLKKPSMLKSLSLRGLNFGTKLPLASNIHIRSADPDGSLRLEADLAYHGNTTVELDIVLEVDVLVSKITLPVSFKLVVRTVTGRIQLAFSPPPSDLMWVGFLAEPKIELDINSFIGQKHHFVNIPKVTNLIIIKLKQEIVEMMLLPDMDDWPLPHLRVPRGQTREKWINWEYQPGYTPPPAIKTEFDSSDSEDDAPPLPERSTPSPSSSAPTSAPASSHVHHPFASTFASSTDVPAVTMRKTSGGSSNLQSPSKAASAPAPPPAPANNSNSSASTTVPQTSSPTSTAQASQTSNSRGPPPSLPPKPAIEPVKGGYVGISSASLRGDLTSAKEQPPSKESSKSSSPAPSALSLEQFVDLGSSEEDSATTSATAPTKEAPKSNSNSNSPPDARAGSPPLSAASSSSSLVEPDPIPAKPQQRTESSAVEPPTESGSPVPSSNQSANKSSEGLVRSPSTPAVEVSGSYAPVTTPRESSNTSSTPSAPSVEVPTVAPAPAFAHPELVRAPPRQSSTPDPLGAIRSAEQPSPPPVPQTYENSFEIHSEIKGRAVPVGGQAVPMTANASASEKPSLPPRTMSPASDSSPSSSVIATPPPALPPSLPQRPANLPQTVAPSAESSASSSGPAPALPPRSGLAMLGDDSEPHPSNTASEHDKPPDDSDPFADIFQGDSSSTGFYAALSHPPTLPPRPKKSQPVSTDKSRFPQDIYAPESPPKSWSSNTGDKKDSASNVSFSSVKGQLKNFIGSIKDAMDDSS